ncbi:metal ABC transporter solute-binding protein, Zn/Mn family [Alcaligenes endophyticus]|uniref:Zinc ABC transporter substrate-binding protein n=1 Tax=Alcaligenes endophyticus TaxID=1929088 RepID=A0ABT8EG79_9BURK|nr:zinc ABC transporter substrate-binding protein [Alcaligenes endophyticus]MCX5590036.1 zinc ABC transporter substrate-binding protein [Alcaligenes endophyticus]MDN4120301.1 zinc ABC transporter substrate-binding protein [Alcaligenes endophyticus]
MPTPSLQGFVCNGLLMAIMAIPGAAQAQAVEPLRVVASFSILSDMVQEIGGDKIALSTIVGRDADAHTFEPTPSDTKALTHAQLLIVNGLDFEAWIPRLVQSSGYQGPQLVASAGITPLDFEHTADNNHDHDHDHEDHDHGHSHGQHDPHAWQSLQQAQVYVKNIAVGLAQADPANADYYQARAQDYAQRMQSLDQHWRAQFARVPSDKRRVITSHDAFAYFAKAYDIQFLPLLGVSNMAEPSAKEMATLIKQARDEHIAAIFTENVVSPKLAQQMAREVGTKLGGVLYSDALGPEGSEAGTYLGMMDWNAKQVYEALQP